jgi:hypothetical protein
MFLRRKRSQLLVGTLLVGVLGGITIVALRTELAGRHREQQFNVLKSYCTDCHSSAEAAGGVVLEGLTAASVPEQAELFESAVRKLRGRLMPPPGNPQPDQEQIDTVVGFLESSIDAGSQAPRAGHVPIQRLNRTEYAASVKDLLGVEINPAEYLPTEIEVDGFDNIAAALSISPAFLEQYVGVARKVARLAVGEPAPKLASAYFPPPGGDQDGYVDGMPLGTRGGTLF